MDVALACGEPLLQKDGQIDFAHEADALRILPFGRRQEMCIRDSIFTGPFPEVRTPDGNKRTNGRFADARSGGRRGSVRRGRRHGNR